MSADGIQVRNVLRQAGFPEPGGPVEDDVAAGVQARGEVSDELLPPDERPRPMHHGGQIRGAAPLRAGSSANHPESDVTGGCAR